MRYASTIVDRVADVHPSMHVQSWTTNTKRAQPSLAFEIVATVERFDEIGAAWRSLWEKVGAKAFQSHEWLSAWIADMGPAYELRIGVAWREGGRLAAILAMAVHKVRGLRILEWAGQDVCDYCEGIGLPADIHFVWASLERASGVDIVRLKNMIRGRSAADLFTGHPKLDGGCFRIASRWASGDAWFRTLNKKKRNNYTRGWRILEERGAVSLICHQTLPDEALLERLVEMKKIWLRATGQDSYLIQDEHPDRLANLVRALAQIGRLRLFVITCGDDIVAASVNMAEDASICAFFAAYDPKYDRASPGILLMTAYTKWAFDRGFREVDYLRGDEGYKLEFANACTDLFSIVRPVTLSGHLAVIMHRWATRIPTLGREKKSLGPIAGAYMTRAGTDRTTTVGG